MSELFKKHKNVILIIGIAIVIFALYSMFLSGGDDSPALDVEVAGDDQVGLAGRDFLSVLLELRSLKLDEEFFNQRSFVNLRDFSRPVQPQPTGRPNPYAPIGSDPVSNQNPENSSTNGDGATGSGDANPENQSSGGSQDSPAEETTN